MKLKFMMLAALLLPSLALAQGAPVVQTDATFLTLTVNERLPVKEDIATASLRFEAKGNDAKTVQSQINGMIKKALDAIKAEPAVKVSTEAYSVYMNEQNEVYTDKNGKQQNRSKQEWRGSQALVLQSKESAKVQALTGKLQGMGFAVSNYGYTLSPEKADSVRDQLMSNAVTNLKKRAQQAATLLGKKGYVIRDITVDGASMPGPVPIMYKAMRADAAAESMPAPNAEASEQDVTLTLTAKVELKD